MEHAGNLTLAARSGLFPIVLRLALKRVRLPSLLLSRYLSDRGNLLLERLLEWSLGISCGGFDVQTQRAEKVVSEAELILRSKAADLSGMGYDFDLCLKGLQLKGGNVELTAEWLLSGEGEVYRQGGGLEEMKIEEKENPRLVQARELGLICGRPPKLCAHALEIFNDNGDAALMWLFDRGIDFLPGLNVGDPEPGSYTGFGAGADADAASRGGADDAAVLNDLDLGEAGVDFEDDFVSGAAVSAQPPAPEPIVRSGSGSSRVSFSSDGEGGGEVDPLLARLEMLRRGDGPPSAAGGVGEVIDLASLSEAEMTDVVHQALAHSGEFMSEIIQAAHRSTRTISAATIGQAAASIGLVGVRAPSGLVRFERRSAVPTPAPPRAAATGSKGKKSDAPLQAPGVSADSRRGLPEVSFRKLNAASPAALFSSGDGPRLKNRIVSTVTNMANMWRICIPTGLLVIPRCVPRPHVAHLD